LLGCLLACCLLASTFLFRIHTTRIITSQLVITHSSLLQIHIFKKIKFAAASPAAVVVLIYSNKQNRNKK